MIVCNLLQTPRDRIHYQPVRTWLFGTAQDSQQLMIFHVADDSNLAAVFAVFAVLKHQLNPADDC